MNETITAIVENGMLRPDSPLPFAEGARVDVRLTLHAEPPVRTPASVRELVARIAAMPNEGPNDHADAHAARDHDHYLYGAPRRS